MVTVVLQNNTNIDVIPNLASFQTWVDSVFQQLHDMTTEQKKEVCIRIITSEESRTLNEEYRRKKGPTNILSFPNTPEPYLFAEENSLGDLAICAELILEEAQNDSISPQAHWAHLTVHGILHLLGYDHQHEAEAQLMESLEIKILNTLGIDNPYK